MQDVIGYNVQAKTKEIVTSEYAVLDGGFGATNLVQQCNIQYGHRVEPKYEAGTSTVYYVNGQPSGQMSVSRLVGRGGFLDYHLMGQDNSVGVRTFHLSVNTSKVQVVGTDSLTLGGVMFQTAAISYGMGGMEVTENANYIISSLGRSGGGGSFLSNLVQNAANAAVGSAISDAQSAAATAIGI